MPESAEGIILREMCLVVDKMKNAKPNDRSEVDRRWATAITDLEKNGSLFFDLHSSRSSKGRAA